MNATAPDIGGDAPAALTPRDVDALLAAIDRGGGSDCPRLRVDTSAGLRLRAAGLAWLGPDGRWCVTYEGRLFARGVRWARDG